MKFYDLIYRKSYFSASQLFLNLLIIGLLLVVILIITVILNLKIKRIIPVEAVFEAEQTITVSAEQNCQVKWLAGRYQRLNQGQIIARVRTGSGSTDSPLKNSRLTAESSGYLIDLNARPGIFTSFQRGDPIYTLFDPKQLKLIARVPNNQPEIKIDSPVLLEQPPMTTRVEQIFYRKKHGQLEKYALIELPESVIKNREPGLKRMVSFLIEEVKIIQLVKNIYSNQ